MKTKTLLLTMVILLFFHCSLFIACKNNSGEVTTGQTDIYELMRKAIHDNDTKTFDSLMGYIPVIDSLIPMEDEDLTYTLLGYAIKNNNYEFTGKLIDAKADLGKAYETLYFLRGALYLAIECKSDSIVDLLLEKGADPNERYDENGTTALLLSCSDSGCNNISKLLITHGAYINGLAEKDSSWVNIPNVYLLFVAIKSCNLEIAEYLIGKGCRLSLGEVSALELAENECHGELIDFINQYMLDNYHLKVDESWYGEYGYTSDAEGEDWRNQHIFAITIRPDTCIFQGEGYQLYFKDLCTVENARKDTIELYYYYTLDGTSTNNREPYLGILFRKDGKYYLNSSALRDEAINNTDVEIEKEK